MKDTSRNGIIGAALIGLGCGLTAVGVALVIPACTNWSMSFLDQAFKKGREGMEGAASMIGDFAERAGEFTGKAQHRFNAAAKTAKHTTAKAAEAVESAAKYVKQSASA